jgi:hypothetical protein
LGIEIALIRQPSGVLKERWQRVTGRQGALASAQYEKIFTFPGSTTFGALPFFSQKTKSLRMSWGTKWMILFLERFRE